MSDDFPHSTAYLTRQASRQKALEDLKAKLTWTDAQFIAARDERDALRAALAKAETDAARWRALVTTFGPEADVSTPHRPHTMLIAIDTEGCEIREDGHLNFRETLELALDDEILRQKAAEDALNAIQRARTKP